MWASATLKWTVYECCSSPLNEHKETRAHDASAFLTAQASRQLQDWVKKKNVFVFKPLHGLVPQYLVDLIKVHPPVKPLRSADHMLLDVPHSLLKTRADRASSVAAPTLWNDPPVSVRFATCLSVFESHLKPKICFLWLLAQGHLLDVFNCSVNVFSVDAVFEFLVRVCCFALLCFYLFCKAFRLAAGFEMCALNKIDLDIAAWCSSEKCCVLRFRRCQGHHI